MFSRHKRTVETLTLRRGIEEITLDLTCDTVCVKEAKALLEAIFSQVLHDGMAGLSCGVDTASGEPWLRYHGRSESSEGPASWDMVPPPAFVYPAMIKYLLGAAELLPQMPLQGRLRARCEDRELVLMAKFGDAFSFEIKFPEPEG